MADKKTTIPTGVSVEKTVQEGPKAGPPVDVNGDITPITRQEVPQVDATQWSDMNAAQLTNQLSILEKRLNFARQIGHQEMATQITRGIIQLQVLIQKAATK